MNDSKTSQRPRCKSATAALPATGLAALPKLTCPACWPIYSGLLSSLGLGFVNYTPYLFPLTILFLLLSLVSPAYRGGGRRGYKPFFLGLVAATGVVIGKFVLDSDAAMYAGVALLVGAAFWNSWPKSSSGSCPACAPNEPLFISEHKALEAQKP